MINVKDNMLVGLWVDKDDYVPLKKAAELMNILYDLNIECETTDEYVNISYNGTSATLTFSDYENIKKSYSGIFSMYINQRGDLDVAFVPGGQRYIKGINI